jgi:multisubunit Na+/H+ antiporter MnhE subunit
MALLAHHLFQSTKFSRANVWLTVRCSLAGFHTLLVGYILGSLVVTKLHQLHVSKKHLGLFRRDDAKVLFVHM